VQHPLDVTIQLAPPLVVMALELPQHPAAPVSPSLGALAIMKRKTSDKRMVIFLLSMVFSFFERNS
jgi:hypothetical protein